MHTATNLLLTFVLALSIGAIEVGTNDKNFDKHPASSRGLIGCIVWHSLQGDPSALLAKTVKSPCHVPTSFPATNALKNTGPEAQACYDRSGQWISDPWLGAGTVDKETPLGSIIQQGKHVFADVLLYYSCCKTRIAPQPDTCNRCYEKRPSGQCEDTRL
ncbi:unnamed protein product [Rotaria magnacalcarata]|uniref:Secreted protein n=1 Tax=Rotaria magnacalcarata TaxID=392030 RepID=A0A8S3GER5_9BILA|nr:unnamed protein product [Rotaria magnacalcarata]